MALGSLATVSAAIQLAIREKLNTTELDLYKWVKFDNIEYHIDDMICIENITNCLPIFGKINQLIVVNFELTFVLTAYTTLEYLEHFRSYSIKPDVKTAFVSCENLRNKFPSSLYRVKDSASSLTLELISLKYPLN